jgi:membrane protein implicated in regulation of membrane protease activity
MSYLPWVLGAVFMVYGLVMAGPKILFAFLLTLAPPIVLISQRLSGWIATLAALAAITVASLLVLRPLLARRERETGPHAPHQGPDR